MGIISKIRTLHRLWDTKRFIKNVKFLLSNDIADTHHILTDEILDDCVFELDELREYLLPRVPKILDTLESLTLLERQPKSFARYGDGEIWMMQKKDILFQKYDPLLAEKLLKVMKTKRNDLYIGLNRTYFHALNPMSTEHQRNFQRRYHTNLRRFLMEEANPEIQYLDANCLMGYFRHTDQDAYHDILSRRMKIFEGRKVAVVTGKSVLGKLDYDIFQLAASKIIIEAPSVNAFSAYDSILRDISRNVSKDIMIHLILGPTATVMAADLTDVGYVAWDSGHMAKDYDAYMKKLGKTAQVIKEFYGVD